MSCRVIQAIGLTRTQSQGASSLARQRYYYFDLPAGSYATPMWVGVSLMPVIVELPAGTERLYFIPPADADCCGCLRWGTGYEEGDIVRYKLWEASGLPSSLDDIPLYNGELIGDNPVIEFWQGYDRDVVTIPSLRFKVSANEDICGCDTYNLELTATRNSLIHSSFCLEEDGELTLLHFVEDWSVEAFGSYLVDEAGNYIVDHEGRRIFVPREPVACVDAVLGTEDGNFLVFEDGTLIRL